MSRMLGGGDVDNNIGVAVADLQKKYPQVSDTELVNYMVGVYCPVVAEMPGLSDPQRTAKVEAFSAGLFDYLSEQKM